MPLGTDGRRRAGHDGKSARQRLFHPSRAGTLASRRGTWQGRGMADTPPSAAGGILIAICSIGGVVVGLAQGQVTIGFLAGLIIGSLGAVAVWLRDSRR
jgi:hypothetical protein